MSAKRDIEPIFCRKRVADHESRCFDYKVEKQCCHPNCEGGQSRLGKSLPADA